MKRILVVDDEELMRYSLTAAFRDDATEVLAVSNGRAALQVIGEFPFDLCLLDIHLPDINGLAIMQHLRSVLPATRVIIMTGSEVSDAMLKSIKDNAHGLIAKPFELDQVRHIVSRIIKADTPPSWDEGAAMKDGTPSVKWLADDYRKNERRPLSCRITCIAGNLENERSGTVLTADVLDISEEGMCIVTDCDLVPGDVLRFSDAPVQNTGVVRWSMSAGKGSSCRAGIQFVSQESAV